MATTPLTFLPAYELQEKLNAGAITSVELVDVFLQQIERHDNDGLKLNAVISTMPREIAIEAARRLDAERAEGKVRGPMHGLPIIVKDVVATHPDMGMLTTAGAGVFATMKAKNNAAIVDRLIEAGAIILAKTNMTEYCGMKSNDTPVGYSGYKGQTLSAYRRQGLEEKDQAISAGSSSGTAVGISAGFSPFGIGTETTGSCNYPASVSGLYGIKCTLGNVPKDGVFCLSESFDGIGGMARNPQDLATLVKILLNEDTYGAMSDGGIDGSFDEGFRGLSVGIVSSVWGVHESIRDSKWGSPEVVSQWDSAVEKLRGAGVKVTYPLETPDADTLKSEDETLQTIAYYEFPGRIAAFIEKFEANADITSLQDIIAWNEKHPEQGLTEPHTTQTELIAAVNSSMTPEKRTRVLTELRRLAGPEGIQKTMDEQNLDIVLASSECTLIGFSAFLGWPLCTVPLANLEKNGQPYGMFALARKGREDVLFRFMQAWSKTFPGATPPIIP